MVVAAQVGKGPDSDSSSTFQFVGSLVRPDASPRAAKQSSSMM